MIASRFLLHPGARRRRLRDAQAGGAVPPQPARPRDHVSPGILVQMITTKRPTDDMIEVAITSMEEALVADGNAIPEGSTLFERHPLELPDRKAADRPTRRSRPTPSSRPDRASRRRCHERPRRQAGGDRDPVRRRPGPARASPRSRPTRTSSVAWARSWPAWSRRSSAFRDSRRSATSSPARASCATRVPTGEAEASELRAMARDEIIRLEADETRLIEELKVLLLPRDPNDDRDVILEIRAGAGGDEAALFAAELLRMYMRYAEGHRFTPEVLSVNETGIDGDQGGDRPGPRRRRVQPPQVRGRRPSRPAHPGDRVERAHPHLDRDRRRDAGGRRGRGRDRRGARTCGSTSSARPARAASRSTPPTRPCASRTCRAASSSRSRTRRASTRTRPRRCPCCARACSTSRSRSSARPTRRPAGRWSGRAIGATRSGRTTTRRTASRTTASARPCTTCRACWPATSTS